MPLFLFEKSVFVKHTSVKAKISLVRLIAYFTDPTLGSSSLRHVDQFHMPLSIVLPRHLLLTEQTHENICVNLLQIIFLMTRVTLKRDDGKCKFAGMLLLVFPVTSCHMVIFDQQLFHKMKNFLVKTLQAVQMC